MSAESENSGGSWRCLAHTQAELVISTESSSASCRVTLRHPSPGPPYPCRVSRSLLLPAPPCWSRDRPPAPAAPSSLPTHHLSHRFCRCFFFCQHRALKSAGTAKNPVCTTTPQTSLYFYCSVNYCLNFNKSLRQEGGPAVRFLCKHWARQ